MKVTLETQVGGFERALDNAYNTYYESTRKQTEKYKQLQQKDLKDSRRIDHMQKRCARLQESLQHWRTKISNNMKEAEWDALNTFFTRYNKTLLDKTALEAEGKRMSQENDRLRGLIKQFVDGISVNDDVMSQANSLMVVNNSLPRLPRMPGPDHVTVVDGPRVLNLMQMQAR